MSIEIAPAFRVETVRTHLHRGRGYALPHSEAERFAEALLDEFSARVRMGAPQKSMVGADLAAMVEAAERAAHSPDPSACGCGHAWLNHVGRYGCMTEGGCDCRERRPQAAAAAGGTR